MDNLAAAMERDRRRSELLRCLDGTGPLPFATLTSNFAVTSMNCGKRLLNALSTLSLPLAQLISSSDTVSITRWHR